MNGFSDLWGPVASEAQVLRHNNLAVKKQLMENWLKRQYRPKHFKHAMSTLQLSARMLGVCGEGGGDCSRTRSNSLHLSSGATHIKYRVLCAMLTRSLKREAEWFFPKDFEVEKFGKSVVIRRKITETS